jgi:hypothetical protein
LRPAWATRRDLLQSQHNWIGKARGNINTVSEIDVQRSAGIPKQSLGAEGEKLHLSVKLQRWVPSDRQVGEQSQLT